MLTAAIKKCNYRFNKKAYWSQNIITNDAQEMRPAVAQTQFRCFEGTKTKGQKVAIIDGASSSTETSLVLQTDDPDVSGMSADDLVVYEGIEYKVVSVGWVRSHLKLDAKEWVISLR